MRYSVITASTPQALTDEKGASLYLKIPALFDKMKRAGWIKPVVNKPKVRLYKFDHLDQCVARLEAGEYPDPE